MNIIDYFESENQADLKAKIGQCDWSAARFLVELLGKGTFDEMHHRIGECENQHQYHQQEQRRE